MGESKKNLKTIFIVVGLLISLGVMLALGNRIYNLLAKASGSPPENVEISQITTNSAMITFTTTSASSVLIEYGTNPTNLTLFANDTDTTSHKIVLSLLTPNTTYYFHIKIGDTTHDNSGVPWTFTTESNRASLPTPTLGVTKAPSLQPGSTSSTVVCGDIAGRMGSRRGSPQYDSKYDLNSDGVVNSVDMSLCKK